ncbi:hypothetical protein ACFC0D_33850 [Streptomyces sp. NPDC056222]|uniref:hypothetical protein n=1 Tax=Streptomyces sp. NPDC056222 TaxID=3345749 RepID=UPI0035E2D367
MRATAHGVLRRARARARSTLSAAAAHGDEGTARIAIDELGDAICALGFVVGEATAPTVPFLLELAGAPHVTCKAELLALLVNIYRTTQWHSAAAAARGGKHDANYPLQPGWEAAARTAVDAGRSVIERVADSVRPEEATPARKLLQVMDDTPPFAKL